MAAYKRNSTSFLQAPHPPSFNFAKFGIYTYKLKVDIWNTEIFSNV